VVLNVVALVQEIIIILDQVLIFCLLIDSFRVLVLLRTRVVVGYARAATCRGHLAIFLPWMSHHCAN